MLSDSFGENAITIYDLADAPQADHFAVGSQLIYNRDSGQSLFFSALTSRRFPVLFDLRVEIAPSTAQRGLLHGGLYRSQRDQKAKGPCGGCPQRVWWNSASPSLPGRSLLPSN